MAKNTEKLGTTKMADRLSIDAMTFAKRMRDIGLPTLKVVSLGEKDFKVLGDEMTKSRKTGDWIQEFDFDSFAYKLELVVGAKRLLIGSATMNVIDVEDRREILDKLNARTGLVNQAEIDKYLKVALERAAKRDDVKKIDADIEYLTRKIADLKKFLANLPKSIEGVAQPDRERDLLPIAAKIKLGGYVHFVFALDAAVNPYRLMKDHFVKPMPYPLPSFPPKILEKLISEFGADEKGSPDFAAARKIAVGLIDARAMPAYRKDWDDVTTTQIKATLDRIRMLTTQRKKLLGQP